MTNFDEFLNEQMKDPEFKAEWDALDPFYSEQNTARLRKSNAEMENTGGTVHDVSFLTDSLTGILPEEGDADTARREALARKYDLK